MAKDNNITEENNRDLFSRLRGCMVHDTVNFEKELKAALAGGFPINFTDDDGRTLLYWAADLNVINQLRVLKREGAKLNIADNRGFTPLGIARLNFVAHGDPIALDVSGVLEHEYDCLESDEHWKNFEEFVPPHAVLNAQEKCKALNAHIENLKKQKAQRKKQQTL